VPSAALYVVVFTFEHGFDSFRAHYTFNHLPHTPAVSLAVSARSNDFAMRTGHVGQGITTLEAVLICTVNDSRHATQVYNSCAGELNSFVKASLSTANEEARDISMMLEEVP